VLSSYQTKTSEKDSTLVCLSECLSRYEISCFCSRRNCPNGV